MSLGYDKKVYIMAFDHRGSFTKLFGLSGTLSPEDTARVAGAKMLIFEGLQRAVAEGAPRETAGVLVDEQFGAEVARKARADGYPLAMPVERSGQDVVDAPVGAGRYRRRHRLVSDRAERLGEPGTTASVGGAYRAVRHRTITGRGTPAAVSLTHTS